MINLTNTGTSDKLEMVTAGSSISLDVHVSWVDKGASAQTPGRTNSAISSATTTTICGSVASGEFRNVKTINARNKHATGSVDVTVQFDIGGTDYELYKVTLAPNDVLQYIEGVGWFVIKPLLLNAYRACSADVVNATTSFADITDLTVPLLANKTYCFEAQLTHVNNASTTGSRFGYNIGAAPTDARISTIDTVTTSVTASAHSAGSVTARDTAITAQTTGSTSDRLANIVGFIIPSADGTFAMRCASEVAVAAGITVRKGSWLHIWEATQG